MTPADVAFVAYLAILAAVIAWGLWRGVRR